MAEYKFHDLEVLTGASRSDLIYWLDRRQVVQSDLRRPGGPGRHRVFSFHNVFETAIAKHLSNHGLEAERIKRILNSLRWTAGRHRPTRDVPAKPPDAEWVTFTRRHTRQPMAWLLIYFPYYDVPIVFDRETLMAHFERRSPIQPQSTSLIAVDLKALVEDLERKTGDHLE